MDTALYSFAALQNRRLHLGVCGSVAAYKAVELMRTLQKLGVQVNVTLTDASTRFIAPLTFEALGAGMVCTRMFAQDEGVLFSHLQPGQIAHAFMIAPATAATLAHLAAGQADTLLSVQVLAFEGSVVLAPTMNSRMWNNPATQRNVRILTDRGHVIVRPAPGLLACGETGEGRLADLPELALAAAKSLLPQDMAGKSVLLTLGPTWEQWDSVRAWTNLSTGRMGACLAYAAYLRGARVHAIAGPGVPWLPAGVDRHDVRSAKEMHLVAQKIWPQAEYGIFTAAVADFFPIPFGENKFKKQDAKKDLNIRFFANPDILADLATMRAPHQKILGFAAEANNLEVNAREKMQRKKTHMIAANLVNSPGSGFGSTTNRLFVCDTTGREEHWPLLSKANASWRLLDWLLTL